eukprot:807905-Amphidinium_carterae.1
MSLSRELYDLGMPTEVLGADAHLWCQCYNASVTDFVGNKRWGSAPDAMLLCKLLKVNLLIIESDSLLHSTVASRDAIKPRAFIGPKEYFVFDRRGRPMPVKHFSQVTNVLPTRDAKTGGAFGFLAPFLSWFFLVRPGGTQSEKRPMHSPGRKKSIQDPIGLQEPLWPTNEQNRQKYPFPSPLASWREQADKQLCGSNILEGEGSVSLSIIATTLWMLSSMMLANF